MKRRIVIVQSDTPPPARGNGRVEYRLKKGTVLAPNHWFVKRYPDKFVPQAPWLDSGRTAEPTLPETPPEAPSAFPGSPFGV